MSDVVARHHEPDQSRIRGRVAVVGGGAAGVSAAYRLRRAGLDPVVFESDDSLGGRARTVWRDGFGFDIGAGALPSTNKHLHKLIASIGAADELVNRGAVVGVLRDGSVSRIARRKPLSFLNFDALGARSKLSLWRLGFDLARMYSAINYEDLSTAARFDDQTVREYADRYYPTEVRENLIAALTRGLLLVEPEQTSVVDLFAAVKSLLVADHLWTHPDGVGFFIERAARGLSVNLSSTVDTVTEDSDGVELVWSKGGVVHRDRFDAAVLAVSAGDLLTMHKGLDAERARYLNDLDYSQSIVVSLGVGSAPPETASMVLVPRDLNRSIPAIGLGHNLAPGRVPPGSGILTVFYMREWSRQHWHDDDATLVELTVQAVNELRKGWADDVRASHVARWSPAVVASRPGTFVGLRDFAARSRYDRRIQLAGDYHAQTSVNASVAAGEGAAARVTALLRTIS
jgi:protoporphyrinogen/coproporphyrinogen III oxidase